MELDPSIAEAPAISRQSACSLQAVPGRQGIVTMSKVARARKSQTPLVTIEIIQGVFTARQKRDLIERVTAAVVWGEG
jgi:hypothetical protein